MSYITESPFRFIQTFQEGFLKDISLSLVLWCVLQYIKKLV